MRGIKKQRNFMGIRTSGFKAFIDDKILEGEKPYILAKVLRTKGYKVSPSYLYEYQHYFLASRKAKADSILETLEEEGLITAISETSLLKAIIAHASSKVKEASLQDGLEAAKILLTAKLHLATPVAEEVGKMMKRWFEPIDAESKEAEPVTEIEESEEVKENAESKVQ